MKQNVMQVVIPLIVVLLILPGEVMAKKVAHLSIEKTGQKTIEGKLIHVDVDEKSLVLQSDNGGVKIYMNEIDTIKIKRKSSVGKGLLVGFGLGAGLGLILTPDDPDGEMLLGPFPLIVILGSVCGFLGVLSAAARSKYKKIRVKGQPPGEIKKILKKLKKMALK